jgi:hypothetical protein
MLPPDDMTPEYITMSEEEAAAYVYCLEYAQHTPPDQWNLSPEIKEWLGKILMKIEKEKHL